MKPMFILFSLAMIATRFPFGGSALHLLDVSWALFFLLGYMPLPIRSKLVGFAWFSGLGWVIDLAATEGGLVGSYCMTLAYVGMPVAYAALTLAGIIAGNLNIARPTNVALEAVAVVLGVGAGALAAFIISNLFFFTLSGYFGNMSLAEFSSAVAHYFPSYLLTAQLYVVAWFCLVQRFDLHQRFLATTRAEV